MRITELKNGSRIITFGPHASKDREYSTVVYEKAGRRLTVDTVSESNVRCSQVKTLSAGGNVLKEIVIKFVNGVRTIVQRIR